VVRFIGACCELPTGLTDALAEAAAAAAAQQAASSSSSSNALIAAITNDPQQQQQQQGVGVGGVLCVPARLAREVKLAIVMELCHLGSLFSMIAQVRVLSGPMGFASVVVVMGGGVKACDSYRQHYSTGERIERFGGRVGGASSACELRLHK
jgi:hypothetical protein